jgi:DNA polymerase-3 subunit chi
MTEISFYILASKSSEERYRFACRLIEKVYHSGQFCDVLLDNDEDCAFFDDLLWTFRAGSFIPHQRYDPLSPNTHLNQVLLRTPASSPQEACTLLCNLSTQLPKEWQTATRILEILDNSESSKMAGRQRYTIYKQAQATLTTYKI